MRAYAGRMQGFPDRGGESRDLVAAEQSQRAALTEPGPDAESVTAIVDRPPFGGGSTVLHTEALPMAAAASVVDPGAETQVISRGSTTGSDGRADEGATPDASPAAPHALVSRRVAAEIGMYAGAGLVLMAIAGVVIRGWTTWDPAFRWAFIGLGAVGLVAAGLFVRLPWRRPCSDERRRAVSAMLTTGVVVIGIGVGAAVGTAQGAAVPDSAAIALPLGAVLAMLLVNFVARTPVSESGLLAAIGWSAWAVVPPGPGTWAFLAGLGVAWAGLGIRWARGRRTAGVLGVGLALVASVGMSAGPWAWPTRAMLAAVVVMGLGAFLRGRPNWWLALGAGAAAALAGAVAGDVVGPVLALLIGGLATMVVSWIALRSARRS